MSLHPITDAYTYPQSWQEPDCCVCAEHKCSMKIVQGLFPRESTVHPSYKDKAEIDECPYQIHLTYPDRPFLVVILLSLIVQPVQFSKEQKTTTSKEEWYGKISQAEKGMYKTCRVCPLVAYVLARENEIKTVRIILSGKANNLPEDSIRERVREMYV